MIGVEVIALEDSCRMGAKRLVYDSFNAVSRNDGLLRKALDIFGRYKLLGDDDDPAARLRLFLVFPASTMNLGVPIVVRYLHVDERHIGIQRPQEQVLFARERTLHALHIFGRRSRFEA